MISVSIVLAILVAILAPALATAHSAICAYHVIQRGETLYSIARSYGVSVYELEAANTGVRPSPGRVLSIPCSNPVRPVPLIDAYGNYYYVPTPTPAPPRYWCWNGYWYPCQ